LRKAIVTPVAVLAVLVMALTGCGQKNQSGGSKQSGVTSESAPMAQLNVVDRGQLKDGGTLRLAIDQLPTEWNPLNVNGDTADLGTTIWRFVGATYRELIASPCGVPPQFQWRKTIFTHRSYRTHVGVDVAVGQ